MVARLRVVLALLLACGAVLGTALPAGATGNAAWYPEDIRHPDQSRLATLPFNFESAAGLPRGQLRVAGEYAVGMTRLFPALNDALGFYEFRTFTLRAIGKSGEVWVASDLQFPIGDCRGLVDVSQDKINYLLDQFDTHIRPVDTGYFGDPARRDGSKATLPTALGLPADYYAGADRDIILIDNIRDDNYYDFAGATSYIVGFFSPAFALALNRNIITIDAYDWTHRTGANPPHEPDKNPCKSRSSRPFLIEQVFAHEYQHLIHFDYDPAEQLWVNEGMSDFAEAVNGYSYVDRPFGVIGYDSHIQSFLGFQAIIANGNPVALSGPENSLPLWGDQGGNEILADYGIAYAFMLYVNEHFGGAPFMRAWQNNPRHGFAGFENTLQQFGYATTFAAVYHDFAVAMVTDQLIDDGAQGPDPARYSVKPLHAQVSLNTTQAYGTPGAPPWGSDYVKITDVGSISALRFAGATQIVRQTPWVSRTSGPAGWKGGPVLWSGSRNNYDGWLVTQLTLEAGPQLLSFDTYFDIEECYDYGFVRVSTDGGKNFTSLGNADTRDCVSNNPNDPTSPDIAGRRPGFTGLTKEWRHTQFDLSAYAGQAIVLAFEYSQDAGKSGNDTSAANNGWWIDNLMLNDTVLSDGTPASLKTFTDITAVQPIPTSFTVQIVGVSGGRYTVLSLPLGEDKAGGLEGAPLSDLATYDYIVVLVTFDAPTDPARIAPIPDYARYALAIVRNGETIVLPGGGLQR